jgi:hypothetical protein
MHEAHRKAAEQHELAANSHRRIIRIALTGWRRKPTVNLGR